MKTNQYFRSIWHFLSGWLVIVILSPVSGAYAQSYAAELNTIKELRLKSELSDARFLAPNLYQKANESLESAKALIEKKSSSKRISKQLAKATQGFKDARRTANIAKEQLALVIAARQDAIAAQAVDYATEPWQQASTAFKKLVTQIEKGRLPSNSKTTPAVEQLFRDAELYAIKSNYFKEARERIDKALENKVERYAPKLLGKAQATLLEAEQALDKDRYDTDRPRSLARQAKIDAGHALLIAEDAKQLRKNKVSYESLALTAELPLHEIAETLDLSIAMDEGKEPPTQEIIAAIEELKQDSQKLQTTLEEVEELSDEVTRLNTNLGEQSSKLKEQAEFRNKLQKAEAIFAGEAARVYRQGSSIRISAYGFNFKPGKADLQSSQSELLKKMMQTIRLFPGCKLVLEGHTDSYGSDASNLLLSEQRAESVGNYLRERQDKLLFKALQTVGFGESNPIANNETKSGREKNRRIELVINEIR